MKVPRDYPGDYEVRLRKHPEEQHRMAEYANKSRLPHNFAVNDKVWLSTKNLSIEEGSGSRKLHPKFCGPFVIIEKINNVTFRLKLSEPMIARRIHNAFHVTL